MIMSRRKVFGMHPIVAGLVLFVIYVASYSLVYSLFAGWPPSLGGLLWGVVLVGVVVWERYRSSKLKDPR